MKHIEVKFIQKSQRFKGIDIAYHKSILPKIQGSPDLTQHTNLQSMNEPLINVDVMESLTKIEITKRGKRQRKQASSATDVMSWVTSIFHNQKCVWFCTHVIFVICVWVSVRQNNLIMTNTKADILFLLEDSCFSVFKGGLHMLNSKGDLIYIDRQFNINKLSNDIITITPMIQIKNSNCVNVYWRSTGRNVHWRFSVRFVWRKSNYRQDNSLKRGWTTDTDNTKRQ